MLECKWRAHSFLYKNPGKPSIDLVADLVVETSFIHQNSNNKKVVYLLPVSAGPSFLIGSISSASYSLVHDQQRFLNPTVQVFTWFTLNIISSGSPDSGLLSIPEFALYDNTGRPSIRQPAVLQSYLNYLADHKFDFRTPFYEPGLPSSLVSVTAP